MTPISRISSIHYQIKTIKSSTNTQINAKKFPKNNEWVIDDSLFVFRGNLLHQPFHQIAGSLVIFEF